jgi:hypothetical protein
MPHMLNQITQSHWADLAIIGAILAILWIISKIRSRNKRIREDEAREARRDKFRPERKMTKGSGDNPWGSSI